MTSRARDMKVAFVAAMPAPYRLPVWDALAARVGELNVLFCSQREANRVWDVMLPDNPSWESKVLPGVHRYVNVLDWGAHFNPSIVKELRRIQPDAIVISGWDSPTYLAALAYGRTRRVPVVMAVESHRQTSQVKRGPIAVARRLLARTPDTLLALGRGADEYLRELGVPADRIYRGILPVDAERIGAMADAAHEARVSGAPVRILYVGRLTANKGLPELLAVFDMLPEGLAELTIVGHGELEDEVRRRAAASTRIRYLGATTTVQATASAYALGDVFAMPTHRDVWGLVINEALAAGLYVVASPYAGATADLVADAPLDVGQVVDPHDIEGLRTALLNACNLVVAGKVDRTAIAQWGRTHTPDRLAEVYVRAIEGATKR